MGKQSIINPESRIRSRVHSSWAVLLAFLFGLLPAFAQTAAPAVPLILPAGMAYDAAGNLLFAESGRHLIRRMTPAGLLTTLAGTGTQGFAGDGGPATAALLDTPTALALDGSGNLFFSDSHNYRIRRIDAATGVLTTTLSSVDAGALALDSKGNLFFVDSRSHQLRRVDAASGALTTIAGTGVQGFSGDGGPALAANLDTPSGLAVSPTGDLWLADTHNHRIRRISAATGVITTVTASAALPRGLALDASGQLLFADAALQQVLRVDASGAVSVVAGSGTQNFAGDGSPAPAALLDSPSAVTLSPAGLPTLADAANGRIRQVDAANIIHTLAGLGASSAASFTLSAPAVSQYGSGTATATVAASPATGSVTLFDTESQAAPQVLGSASLAANAASFSLAALAAGPHRLLATYAGDTLHLSAQSNALSLSVFPLGVNAAPASFAILYGQSVPTLTGTLTGVLAQDAQLVSLALASSAGTLSPPGSYAVTASLGGPSAGNYTLSAASAAVTIAKAPVLVSLDTSAAPNLKVLVASTTSGLPSGPVTLLDGASFYASGTLSAGVAVFSSANLSAGPHTLTASYAGDTDFLPAVSPSGVLTVGTPGLPDFTLTANGQTSMTVAAGTAAQYSFSVNPINPVNGPLASPILLAASGLPPGATASFNPAYLPPSNAPATFVLTVTTPKAALATSPLPYLLALLLPVWMVARRRSRRALLLLATALSLGCGDRVANEAGTVATTPYTITVTATATQSTGVALVHTANVTLNVQH